MSEQHAIWRGPEGRGIASVTFILTTRMLRMTFTDVGTQDVGPLPIGEGGAVGISRDAGNVLEIRDDGLFGPSNLIATNW